MLQLPKTLERLIAEGAWPNAKGPSMTEQQFKPLAPPERVRLFAEDESLACLAPPPFTTIAQEVQKGGAGDFWERLGALHQIVPEQALIIGDFGLGSDSPIILAFDRSSNDPPVLRAKNFDHFVQLLGLIF